MLAKIGLSLFRTWSSIRKYVCMGDSGLFTFIYLSSNIIFFAFLQLFDKIWKNEVGVKKNSTPYSLSFWKKILHQFFTNINMQVLMSLNFLITQFFRRGIYFNAYSDFFHGFNFFKCFLAKMRKIELQIRFTKIIFSFCEWVVLELL